MRSRLDSIQDTRLAPSRDGGHIHIEQLCGDLRATATIRSISLGRRGWSVAWPYARRRTPLAIVGASASLGSYGIALWSMTRAPVAMVAALRETSVLFAVLIGAFLLKEAFTLRRAVGTAAIVAGVMALRMG